MLVLAGVHRTAKFVGSFPEGVFEAERLSSSARTWHKHLLLSWTVGLSLRCSTCADWPRSRGRASPDRRKPRSIRHGPNCAVNVPIVPSCWDPVPVSPTYQRTCAREPTVASSVCRSLLPASRFAGSMSLLRSSGYRRPVRRWAVRARCTRHRASQPASDRNVNGGIDTRSAR